MKRYECFRTVRDAVLNEFALKPNDAHSVGLYSVYDVERQIFNPPFTSDDLSALHVFMNACVDNPNIYICLHKVAEFNTDIGKIEQVNAQICDSIWIHEIIANNGGIEE